MTNDPSASLAALGDDLERATTATLARRRRRTSVIRAAVAVAVLSVVATGTVVATGILSPKTVAIGMPAGAVIFAETDPACALDADAITYHCTLANAPVEPAPIQTPPPGKASTASTPTDFTGSKETLVIGGVIAGGCIGRTADGIHWDCYLGDAAVDQGILTHDFLGEPASGPGWG